MPIMTRKWRRVPTTRRRTPLMWIRPALVRMRAPVKRKRARLVRRRAPQMQIERLWRGGWRLWCGWGRLWRWGERLWRGAGWFWSEGGRVSEWIEAASEIEGWGCLWHREGRLWCGGERPLTWVHHSPSTCPSPPYTGYTQHSPSDREDILYTEIQWWGHWPHRGRCHRCDQPDRHIEELSVWYHTIVTGRHSGVTGYLTAVSQTPFEQIKIKVSGG